MASGIFFPLLEALSTVNSKPIVIDANKSAASDAAAAAGPWTPPQFGQDPLTIVTVPASIDSQTGQPATAATDYVFDAVLRVTHHGSVRSTEHPVLTGANISDHAYAEPQRVVLEVGMSDAMASYSAGMWTENVSKGIAAFQVLDGLRQARTLVTLTTRLKVYENMLIESVTSPDDVRSAHGLRATVTFKEILSAGASSSNSGDSARPQTTGDTQSGTQQGSSPDQSDVDQHVLPSSYYSTLNPGTLPGQYYSTLPAVPGSGAVSSTNLGQVQKLWGED